MQQQDREHRTWLVAAKRQRSIPLDDLERTKDPELHAHPQALGLRRLYHPQTASRAALEWPVYRSHTAVYRLSTTGVHRQSRRRSPRTANNRELDMIHHPITRTIALTLALAAAAAPAAWADPQPLANIPAHSRASAPVVPNPDEQTAIVAPTTSAPRGTAPVVRANPDQQAPAVATHRVGHSSPSTPATMVRALAPNGGFEWGDAGIGAAAGLVLSMLAIGSARMISRRRTRRSESALAS